MSWRHEWKHEINLSDVVSLRQRLRAVMKQDPYGIDGKYEIRSLYFDTPSDKALREKTDGMDPREKFRLRYYNRDISLVRLEKKSKYRGLCRKQSVKLKEGEVRMLLNGKYQWMQENEEALVKELYCKMGFQGLRPKTIVDYTREAYLYSPGNVRVTLDYHIRTGLYGIDFLRKDCVTIPAGDVSAVLEVKWDSFLPSVIRDVIQVKGRRTTAFSKYAVCRIYG